MSTSKLNLCLVALSACLLLALPATAELSLRGNTVSVSGNTVTFKVADNRFGYDLTVNGPDGYFHQERFEAGSLMGWTAVGADGLYNYELVPVAAARVRGQDDPAPAPEAERVSGTLRLEAGTFPDPDRPEKLEKDIQHLDDVIITFSLCVGNDCVNGESFGFDTVRLKENNLRIHFDDTSNSGSFPSNDWRIVINDSSNGGDNYFRVEDSTAGRSPFQIDAGAPSNSLRVDSAGDVGIGKSNPVVELHVVDGDSPTLRLEQDGSSGFTPQTFDLVSNEANFFIRDVTNGSQLPFRIKPGADTDALFIAANNDIGMGTNSPSAALHVRNNNNTRLLRLERTDGNALALEMLNTAIVDSARWQLQVLSNGVFGISRTGTSVSELEIDDDTGAVSIAGSTNLGDDAGDVTTVTGTFVNNSSRTLKTDFRPVDPRAMLERLASIPINEWSLIGDPSGRRHVGPFSEDFEGAFGLGTIGRYIVPLDVQGVTIAAVQGLYESLLDKEAEIEALQERLAALEKNMASE